MKTLNETTSSAKTSNTAPTHEEITLHAEILWRARGCPKNRDVDIWLEAERQLTEEHREILKGARS